MAYTEILISNEMRDFIKNKKKGEEEFLVGSVILLLLLSLFFFTYNIIDFDIIYQAN